MRPLLFTLLLLSTFFRPSAQTADSTTTDPAGTDKEPLRAVTVTAAPMSVDIRVDRTVITPGASATSAGRHVLDLLRSAPGVMVDGNDQLQMSGRSGVNVYIDGRPTDLAGSDLSELLKTIDAANIKSIEVITSPSVRFEAAGNAGIINLVLKKSISRGFNGSLSGSHAQSTHARQSASTQLNYRRDRWNLFTNTSVNRGYQDVQADNDRISGDKAITQRGLEQNGFHSLTARTGLDYSISKRSTAGLVWMYNDRYSGMNIGHLTLIGTDSAIRTRSTAPFLTGRNALNGNYTYTGPSSTLTLNLDHTAHRSAVNNDLVNAYSGRGPVTTLQLNNFQSVRISSGAVRLDYSRTAGAWKGEAGFRYGRTATDNRLLAGSNAGSGWTRDTGRTNFFLFGEAIGALYGTGGWQGKKVSVQAGLRAEHSRVQGRSTDLKGGRFTVPDTSYLNLFPSLFLQYRWQPKHALGFSYMRRIDRPSYADGNPFRYALDALNSEQGNPYLLPQLTHSVSLGYTYKWATSFKIEYSHTNDYIEQLTFRTAEGTVNIPQNAGTRSVLNLSLGTPLRLGKRLQGYLQAAPYYQRYLVELKGFGVDRRQDSRSWGLNGYFSQQLSLPKEWSAEVNGWYNFGNRTTIYTTRPIGSLNFGGRKTLSGGRLTLGAALTDVLNTQRWNQEAVNDGIYIRTYRKWESRNVTLSLSWRFGNRYIKSARERSDTNEEVLQRME